MQLVAIGLSVRQVYPSNFWIWLCY
jgi:hypothetical protein